MLFCLRKYTNPTNLALSSLYEKKWSLILSCVSNLSLLILVRNVATVLQNSFDLNKKFEDWVMKPVACL